PILSTSTPFQPKLRLGRHENLPNHFAIPVREMSKILRLILPAQHLAQPRKQHLLRLRRQSIERFAIDQVTAGILEHPRLEIELSQRPPLRIEGPAYGEFLGIAARPPDRPLQRSLL